MKKFFALLLSLAMVLALVACGQKDPTPDTPDTPDDPQTKVEYKVAMITDYGDITDQSSTRPPMRPARRLPRTTASSSATSGPPAITPPTVSP